MEFLISLILTLVPLIVFPLLIEWHKERVEVTKSKLPSGGSLRFKSKVFSRWTVIAFGLAVVLVIIPFARSWYSQRNTRLNESLDFFTTEEFKAELRSMQTLPAGTPSANDVTELIRIFGHVSQLQKAKQHEEAERILLQIKRGRDDYGEIPRVNSYVVDNNLGVLAFLLRRNKNFDASERLLAASRNEHIPDDKARQVEDNIRKLDSAVNALD